MESVPIAHVGFEVVPVLDEKGMAKLLQDIGNVIEKTTINNIVAKIVDIDEVNRNYDEQEKLIKEERKNITQERVNNKDFGDTVETFDDATGELFKAAFYMRIASSAFNGTGNLMKSMMEETLQVIEQAGEKSKQLDEQSESARLNSKDVALLRDIFMKAGNVNADAAVDAVTSFANMVDTLAVSGYTGNVSGQKITFGRNFRNLSIFEQLETAIAAAQNIRDEGDRKKYLQELLGSRGLAIGQGVINAADSDRLYEIFKTLGRDQKNYNTLYKKNEDEKTALILNQIELQNQQARLANDALRLERQKIQKEITQTRKVQETAGAAIKFDAISKDVTAAVQAGIIAGFKALQAGDLKGFTDAMAMAIKASAEAVGMDTSKKPPKAQIWRVVSAPNERGHQTTKEFKSEAEAIKFANERNSNKNLFKKLNTSDDVSVADPKGNNILNIGEVR